MLSAILKYITTLSLCRRLIFICRHLPLCLPNYWRHVSSFVNRSISDERNHLTEDQCRLCFENIISLDAKAAEDDETLLADLCSISNKANVPLGFVLVSLNDTCRVCKSKLRVKSRGKEIAKVVLYDDEKGTILASHFTKFCSKTNCLFRQYYGKHTLTGGEIFYDPDWFKHKYLLSTMETGFSMSMLRRYDVELSIGMVSYLQKARMYNSYHGYTERELKIVQGKTIRSELYQEQGRKSAPQELSSCELLLHERKILDRRRLEDGHLQFAMLNVIQHYPNKLATEKISFKETAKALNHLTPLFLESFTSYFSEHCCDLPGCRSCLVLDGNMKNSREACKATDVGFTQYEGLPGSISTGCTNSPAFESRYCAEHKNFSCDLKSNMDGANDEDFVAGPVTRAMAKENDQNEIEISENGIIESILDKKETRCKSYYKVKFLGRPDISWEPEEDLPEHLLKAFNMGGEGIEVAVKESAYNGQICKIFYTKTSSDEVNVGEPVLKKARQSIELPQEGIFSKESFSLNCNTEKDKNLRKRKNERSAGILCGMWPCGIFNMVAELYKSESKSQVYAVLHEAMRLNEKQFETLEYIIYDDGCHLKKYAENSKRCHLTAQTTKLSKTKIVVDKMHMRGHVDPWCKTNCDSRTIKELEKVDTEVCEQAFSWLSSYKKITRRMSQENFIFFILYLLHLHNIREERKLVNSGLMIKRDSHN